ncbi:MAG: hypothetical protein ACF8PN_15845 [Phycisphaerales bacterium]
MITNRDAQGRSFWTWGCVYAVCGALATPAIAQDFGDDPEFATDPAFGGTEDEIDGNVSVTEFLTVDLHVQDTDLAKVLQMLSIQSQKNIIVTKNVAGSVTAHLYDVTFYEALDAILNANGFGYIEEGNFIEVYTLEELAQIEQANLQMVHQRFELSYLNASDAAIFVTPLLSDDGSIAINGEAPDGFDPDESDGGRDTWAFSATLVVSDYPENVEAIAAMLDELDTRPKQVLVEATVLQTTLTEDNAWGVDWSLVGDVNFSNFTNPLSGVDDLLAGSDDGFQPSDNQAWNVRSNAGRTSGPGTLKLGVVSDDISVFMRVLDEVSDTTVMSRPRVMTLNRQRGEILIGRRIGYLSSTSTETSTTQTVQFLDTGTQLIFRPFVGKDGFIRMELKPSISEGVIRDVTGASGDTITVPDEITQELTTNVVVHNGHTIVLGGLFREETTLSRRQVPVLGDIPLVGAAFRGHDDSTRRSEITFLITPSIMNDEVLLADGRNELEMVERHRIGARKGVLPWSRDRLTAQHNMKAEEAMREGDRELALWHINQSLNLNENQPRIREMRERITGETEEWMNGAIFDTMLQDLMRERAMRSEPIVDAEEELVDPLAQEFAAAESDESEVVSDEDFETPAELAEAIEPADASLEPSNEPSVDEFDHTTGAAAFAGDEGDSEGVSVNPDDLLAEPTADDPGSVDEEFKEPVEAGVESAAPSFDWNELNETNELEGDAAPGPSFDDPFESMNQTEPAADTPGEQDAPQAQKSTGGITAGWHRFQVAFGLRDDASFAGVQTSK